MRKIIFCSLLFAFLGYLFSCFLANIGGELPLEPTMHDYVYVFLNPLAIPYSVMGFIFGSLVFLIFLFVKKLIQRRMQ